MRSLAKNKKGMGVVSGTVTAVIGLVFTVVIGYVLVATLLDANLITGGSTYDYSAGNISANLTSGVAEVATKIPTILLIVAVVFLFGALALLVLQARRMGMFGGGGGL